MHKMKVKNFLILFSGFVLFLGALPVHANDRISVEAMPMSIVANGMSTSVITAKILNTNGSVNPTAMNMITFSLDTGTAGGTGGDHTYNFSGITSPSVSHSAYKSNSIITTLPPSTGLLNSEISSGEYTSIGMLDNNAVDVLQATAYYSAFQSSFMLSESTKTISGIGIKFSGSSSNANAKARIYIRNYFYNSWDYMSGKDISLGYTKVTSSRTLVLTDIYKYVQSSSKKFTVLYVLETMNTKLTVDYVELKVASQAVDGSGMVSYEFVSSTNPVNKAFYSNNTITTPSTPIGYPQDIYNEVYNLDQINLKGDGWNHYTGWMPAFYSAYRLTFNTAGKSPSEISKLEVPFTARVDNNNPGQDFNIKGYIWNQTSMHWDYVSSFMLTPTYTDCIFTVTTGFNNYMGGGMVHWLFVADMMGRSIQLDYSKLDLYTTGGQSAGTVTSNQFAEIMGSNVVYSAAGIASVVLKAKTVPGYVTVKATTNGLITSNVASYGVAISSPNGGGNYASITGNIYYNGTGYGEIRIAAFNTPGFTGEPAAYTSIMSPVQYWLYNLPKNMNYYIGAFMDTNNNMSFDSGEPTGSFNSGSPLFLTGSVTNINITLQDNAGSNSVSGTIYYAHSMSTQTFNAGIAIFTDSSFSEAYLVKGSSATLTYNGTIGKYAANYYLSGLTDGMYYIGAYIDKNKDDIRENWEPYGVYKCGNLSSSGMSGACNVYLSGGYNQNCINLQVFDNMISQACTLRGKVAISNMPSMPAGNVTVELWDSNNGWDFDSFTLYASTVTNGSSWRWDSTNNYNFQIDNIYPRSSSYAYFVRIASAGCTSNMTNYSVYFSTMYPQQYIYQTFMLTPTAGTLTLVPGMQVSNGVDFSTKTVTITPDNDNNRDYANIKFTVGNIPKQSDFSGALARVVIDTNKDGYYEPFQWNDVTWDNNGDSWYGTPPQKLTYDELRAIMAQKDWSMDWWISNYSETAGSQDVNIMWSGRDSLWNMLSAGDYKVKIQLCHSSYWSDNYLGDSNTNLTIKITADGIYGNVYYSIGSSSGPLEGAMVSAGTYDGYAQAFTDANGYYFIGGLPKDRTYNVHAEKKGYDPYDVSGVWYQATGSKEVRNIVLSKGGKLSGTVTLPETFQPYIDQWGNTINELWGYINAWNETTGKFGSANFQILEGQSSKQYEIALPPSNYKVEVNVFGYSRQSANNIEVTSYGATKNFTMARNRKVYGYVNIPSDDAGRTAYVNISLKGSGNMNYAYSGVNISAPSTSTYFTVLNVPANDIYSVNIHAEGYMDKNIFNVAVGTSDVNLGTCKFTNGGEISGTIKINGDLTNIMNNSLWINAWSPSTNFGSGANINLPESSTGTVQNFKIKGLVDGMSYNLDTWLSGYEMNKRPYKVTVPSSGVSIELVAFSGSISGKITGSGLDPARVYVTVSGGMGAYGFISTSTVSGAFSVNKLGTGEYIITANQYKQGGEPTQMNPMGTPDGNFSTVTRKIAVTNGKAANTGDIILSAGGEISGKIYVSNSGSYNAFDLDGKYVQIAAKKMDWMGMQNSWYSASIRPVDVNYATFSVKGLDKGVYSVSPPTDFNYDSKPEMAGSMKIVTVNTGSRTTVQFNLTEGYMITGSIERPLTGSEGMNIDLSYQGLKQQSWIMSYWIDFSTQPYSRKGNYTVGPVSPGRYIVKVWSQNYRETAKEVTIVDSDVSVAPIILSKGGKIKGRLIDDRTGQLVSGNNGTMVSCEARPWVEGSYRETNQWDMNNKIDEITGNFSLKNLPAGDYIVRVKSINESMYNNMATQYKNYAGMLIAGITVPDTNEDVDLGTIRLKEGMTISGRVTNSSREGLANIRMAAVPTSSHGESVRLEAMTDTEGFYTLKGLDSNIGQWDVIAAVRPDWQEGITCGYGEKTRKNTPIKATDINIVLSEADSSIYGSVVPPNGEALIIPMNDSSEDIPGAMVILQENNKIYDDPMGGIQQASEYNGDFSVSGLVAGSYTLKVLSRGLQTYVADIVVARGANNLGNITLSTGKKLEGTIATNMGTKIKSTDVTQIVAVSADFSQIMFGTLNSDETTKEIQGYTIEGLQVGIDYYIALCGTGKADVFIDPSTVRFTASDTVLNKGIIYKDNPPHFIVQAMRDAVNDKKFIVDVWSNEPLSERNVSDVISVAQGNGALGSMTMSDDRMQCNAGYTTDGVEKSFKIYIQGHDLKGQQTTAQFVIYGGEKGRNEEYVNPVVGGKVIIGEGDNSGFYLPMGTKVKVADTGEEVDEISNLKIFVASIDSAEIGAKGVTKKNIGAYSFTVPSLAVDSTPGEIKSSIYNMEIYLITGPLAQLSQGQTAKVTIEYDSGTVTTDKLDINYYDEDKECWVKVLSNRTIDTENRTIEVDVTHFTKYAAFDDVTAPDVPVLSANRAEAGLVLDWSKSTASDIAGYNIYQSSVPGGPYHLYDSVADNGQPVQTCAITISTGPYFAITALDNATTANESGFSNEVSIFYTGDEYKMWVYPNPFHPTATNPLNIKYRIPQAAGSVDVDIKLFTLTGELVRDTFGESDSQKTGGYVYMATWDAKNESGFDVADGIYLCTIKMGEETIIKKVALIRSN